MKKLFLIIPLLTISINTSANTSIGDDKVCGSSLLLSNQLVPYIYQVLNSGDVNEQGRLDKLQEFVGVNVTGWHRSYPEGKTYKKRTKVAGVVQNVELIKEGDPGKEIYEMTIHSEENGLQKLAFSGSYSPAFSDLEMTGLFSTDRLPNNISLAEAPYHLSYLVRSKNQLLTNIRDAERDIVVPFDLLSVGLDTPPEVAAYKESLRAQKAIAFDDREHSYYEFSISYERPIIMDGKIWPSIRHYVEAQKFVDIVNINYQREWPNPSGLFGSNKEFEYMMNIRIARSPEEAARMGRDRSFPLRPDWEEVKDEIMFKALVAKFTQHKDLYDLLMSTGDALIVEHTERDHYWGDGENGRGKSLLGNLLMKLRGYLKQRLMPRYEDEPTLIEEVGLISIYELVSMEELRKQLLFRIEHMGDAFIHVEEEFKEAYDFAKQIDSSNISDIEKIDRLQMILKSRVFFIEPKFILTKRGQTRQTFSDEFITLISKKYPEGADVNFRYVSVKVSVSSALTKVVVIDLRPLDISHDQKIEIYKIMARRSPWDFVEALALNRFGLSHSEIRELYLHALQLVDVVDVKMIKPIEKFSQEIVDDGFIQEVVNVLHKNHFPTQYNLLVKGGYKWRARVIQSLIEVASFHGLNYKAVYTIMDNEPVTEVNEVSRRGQPDIYPIDQDSIKLILQQN